MKKRLSKCFIEIKYWILRNTWNLVMQLTTAVDLTNASKNNFILWFYPKNCSRAIFLSPEGEYKRNRSVFLNYSRSNVFTNFGLVCHAWMWAHFFILLWGFSHKLLSTSNLGKLHSCTEVIEVLMKEQNLVSSMFHVDKDVH